MEKFESIDKIFSDIPKDDNGFEDIDKFWNVAEKLAFPLNSRLKEKVLDKKSPSTRGRPRKASSDSPQSLSNNSNLPSGESDSDFDYETSSEFSVEYVEELEEDSIEVEDDASTEPENEVTAISSRRASTNSQRTSLDQSIPLSPEESVSEEKEKSTHIERSSFIDSRFSDFSTDSIPTFDKRVSAGTARGDKSSLISDSSFLNETPKSNKSQSRISSKSSQSSNSTFEETEPEITVEADEPEEEEVVEEEEPTEETIDTSSIAKSTVSRSRDSIEPSLILSSSKKTNRSSMANSRRVSFGADLEMSPIDSEFVDPDDLESRLSSSSSKKTTPQRSQLSLNQTSSSVLSSTPNKTPLSTQKSLSYSYLQTPGSNEFIRGRIIQDESFRPDETTLAEEDDDEADMTQNKSNFQSPGLDATSDSFVDNSFLFTINSANKNYAGKNIIQETKEIKKKQKQLEDELLHKKDKKKSRLLKELEQFDNEINPEEAHDEDEDDEEYQDEGTDEEDESIGLRRSRRATKGRRFAFWKGERPIYKEGAIVGVLPPEPTPVKPSRSKAKKIKKKTVQKKKSQLFEDDEEDDGEESDYFKESDEESLEKYDKKKNKRKASDISQDEELPKPNIPSNLTYLNSNSQDALLTWDALLERPSKQQIVCSMATLPEALPLPKTAERPAGKDKVGFANYYFNIPEVAGYMPGYIAGLVDLPPQAIKDAESVGRYAQVFFVASGQEGALEFALEDPNGDSWDDKKAQRVLLSPGDSFLVPPLNVYRLENHSTVTPTRLYWMIIHSVEGQKDFVGSSISEETVASRA